MAIRLRVLFSGAGSAPVEHVFHSAVVRIGRSRKNDLVLRQDRRISGDHAALERIGDLWYAMDAGSTNGTYLNGERLPGSQRRLLNNGDQLRLGPVEIRCHMARDEDGLLDLGTLAEEAAHRAAGVFQHHADESPELRHHAMRKTLEHALESAGPSQARPFLSLLTNCVRFGGGPAGGEILRIVEEIESDRDRLREAALETLAEFGRSFVGARPFESAEQLRCFVQLVAQALVPALRFVATASAAREALRQGLPTAGSVLAPGGPVDTLDADGLSRYLLDWSDDADPVRKREDLEGLLQGVGGFLLTLLAGWGGSSRAPAGGDGAARAATQLLPWVPGSLKRGAGSPEGFETLRRQLWGLFDHEQGPTRLDTDLALRSDALPSEKGTEPGSGATRSFLS